MGRNRRFWLSWIGLVTLVLGALAGVSSAPRAAAVAPGVVAAGSMQSELGCPGDWQPDCTATALTFHAEAGIWQGSWTLPPGDYEVKVALNGSWDENYGAGGQRDGPNIPFRVTAAGSLVAFRYDGASHLLTVTVTAPGGHRQDDNVEYAGLGHNSRDSLYRTPFGAITPGTPLTLRFRTYHEDVTGVQVRFWDAVAKQQFFRQMERAAAGVSCYDPGQSDERCDLWQVTYVPVQPTTLYYRFIARDGSATAYYDDDAFWDGGWGEATPGMQDESFAVTVYDPAFQPLDWLQNGVVYQIFPDRFRNGRSDNDPTGDEPRYSYPGNELEQIITRRWSDLPEGYCRNYTNPAEACDEIPRGRDYYGGDLRGVIQRLTYLQRLGVSVIWFNPIFEAGSNHGYDTQDYYQIDHFLGTNKEFDDLVRQAGHLGIRVVLDGVFNHVSADSPYFDRYGHYESLGACESPDSPYRDWFTFTAVAPGTGPCAGAGGEPGGASYPSWWGFDSLPVLDKSNPEVRALLLNGENPVARYWLEQGASGWRLDVMGDPSFPAGFWPEFRQVVKGSKPDAAIIGELWKRHEVLPMVLGDGVDSSMNYRFRNAILGFFGTIDHKGFVDDGQSDQPPSLFAAKLLSMREDYPDAAWFTMLNLMGSHDTERILWSLTPGESNREAKELNPANLAAGKTLLQLARVVQMTLPGAPTIYYGDEAGVTGADDPDDRRPFPWSGSETNWGPDHDRDLVEQYQRLIRLRAANPAFRQGALSFLLTDDASRTMAYLLRTEQEGAIVALNRSGTIQTLTIPLGGSLPANLRLTDALGTIAPAAASDGLLVINLPPLSAAVLLPDSGQDLTPPAAPVRLTATPGAGQVTLDWQPVPDAGPITYRLYRSPVTGGGYQLIAETAGTGYTETGLPNGADAYYVVRAVDAAGNEGGPSQEASARPAFAIGWANLQWPPTLTHTISAITPTAPVYGQVYIEGQTNLPGPAPDLIAQLGYGPAGSNPAADPSWRWVTGAFNVDAGNNDEFAATLLPDAVGSYAYAYRYSADGGRTWLYADKDGSGNGYDPAQAGSLTVSPSDDTTPPEVPTGLRVASASPEAIELTWEPRVGDITLYGHEMLRAAAPGGPYTNLGLVTDLSFTDWTVEAGATYYYAVRAVDQSFNRSAASTEVSATAQMRTVQVSFTVTVPEGTEGPVSIAGTLSQLDGGHPDWDPAAVVLSRVDATHWAITLSGREGVTLEYKYVQRGSWDYVEKGPACEEIANRKLTLTWGAGGSQPVSDTVANWRNVAPCGN